MVNPLYFVLQVSLLCLCVTEVTRSKNSLAFKAHGPKPSEETGYKITANVSSSLHGHKPSEETGYKITANVSSSLHGPKPSEETGYKITANVSSSLHGPKPSEETGYKITANVSSSLHGPKPSEETGYKITANVSSSLHGPKPSEETGYKITANVSSSLHGPKPSEETGYKITANVSSSLHGPKPSEETGYKITANVSSSLHGPKPSEETGYKITANVSSSLHGPKPSEETGYKITANVSSSLHGPKPSEETGYKITANVSSSLHEPKPSEETGYKITANVSSSLHVTDPKFLSVALGSQRMTLLHETEKLINLASALAPCDIRLGGTSADFLVFDPAKGDDQIEGQGQDLSEHDLESEYSPSINAKYNFTMTGKQWDAFNRVLRIVGWDLLFDVNLFFWRRDGFWNSTNAELLLNYSAAKGIKIPYFQLGNEPNSFYGHFGFRVPPTTLLQDFRILKSLISKYPLYASSKLCGPDVTDAHIQGDAKAYLQEFVNAGAYGVVDGYSIHQYYLDARTARAADFLDVGILDRLKRFYEVSLSIIRSGVRPLPIRLTETSSCYGGGAAGISDRYVAGFVWLDKLGLSAQYGTTRVFRQTILGGSYALIKNSFFPNPDYFLSVLFKRLIEGPVFNISIDPPNKNLRVYAHCARRGLYSAGALAVIYLNLNNVSETVTLTQFQNFDLDLYLLTPGDGGLTSSYVKLNGNTLLLNGNALPPMPPLAHKGNVTVAAQSFGFIVVPQSNVSLCMEFYSNVDSKLNNGDG